MNQMTAINIKMILWNNCWSKAVKMLQKLYDTSGNDGLKAESFQGKQACEFQRPTTVEL